METSIKIDLEDATCDIAVHRLPLSLIKDLPAIKQAVADNLKSALIIAGMPPMQAEEGVNLLLQGKFDIRYILEHIAPKQINKHHQ